MKHPRKVAALIVLGGALLDSSMAMANDADRLVEVDNNAVLTPKKRFFIEPSFSTINSSSTQVAIEGFAVVPAIVVGLINVSQVQRDTVTSALSFRYGIIDRLELGLKVPFVYREESIRQREALKGTPVDSISQSKGDGLGDVEASINYQFNAEPGDAGFWVLGLQAKSRTGKDPFEIQQNSTNQSDSILTISEEQPTGSGFWSAQPSVTYMHVSDPSVLYYSMNYLWNKKRDLGDEFGGVIDPGDAIGFGFGIGVSMNN